MQINLYNADFLNFVEFNITGDNDDYHRCDEESLYLDSSVFYLLQGCFEHANPTYDYFSGTKYNARKIIVLRNDILSNQQEFERLAGLDEFTNLINSRFMGKEFLAELEAIDPRWQDQWGIYNQQIVDVHKKLNMLIEKCAYEEKVLWVIGY